MCALFGWLDYKGIIPKKILKKLTQALANAAEERGTDAAGISYIKDGKVTVYKRPRAAHLIRFNAPDDTKVIMGHTRMATQGDKRHNYNRSPALQEIWHLLLLTMAYCGMIKNFAKRD